MNKKGIIILIIILLGVFGYKFIVRDKAVQGKLVPVENAATALNESLKNGKPTFLEFTSDNCPACRKAKPWIEEFYQKYGKEINFILADVDRGGFTLAQDLGVTAVPTFVYYNKEGKMIDAFAGYPATNSKKYLEEKIKALLKK
ncbi:MAG: thioredoxin 1 [Clostridia bacterium]|nr:thioredoxin 1 [Clostridia bacterium]MDN5323591.1 thioredoxin 1 [Clostridia bacterium]